MRDSVVLLTIAAALASAPAAVATPAVTSGVFASAPTGASAPDSITLGAGSVWVAYTGGTTSDGTPPPGQSTIVRYAPDGSVQASFSFTGNTDGLVFNKATNTVWALQNQDGQASVNTINAGTNAVTPLTYAQVSATQGYDEVAFRGQTAFLSYTNPAAGGDPIIRQIINGASPIQVKDVVTLGQTGLSAFDADSLKLAPNHDLVQSGGDQGTLVFVHAPGTSGQTVKVLPLTQGGVAVSGLDDTFYATAASGTLYASTTKTNQVLSLGLSGLTPGSLFAAIGSLNELALVDPNTGSLTPVITGLSGIHGLAFVPTAVPEPATMALFGLGLAGTLALRRRR